MGEIVLQATQIYKSYTSGNHQLFVLENFSLSVEKNDIITIMGQSGSGKSTALNILGTLDQPDSGSLEINGSRVNNLDEMHLSEIRNRDIGFVFQRLFAVVHLGTFLSFCPCYFYFNIKN